jgi:GntR family transcriptional repressor for pyruvate dehydrogenase complex
VDGLAEILARATADSPVEELVDADVEFHRAIAVAAGNTVLASLIESLSGPTQRARVWRGMTQEGALQRTLDEHRSIFDAIARHDPEMARTWATVHIAGVEDWLRRALADTAP